MLKVTNYVMLDIPLKLEFIKYAVFVLMEMVYPLHYGMVTSSDVMYGGVSSTDFTFCRRTVFVGSSGECIFKCFHGEIISYHSIYMLLETFENFSKFEKH